MRTFALIVGFILLAAALFLFGWDSYTNCRYGFHVTEVAGVTDDGQPIAWPTGESPAFTWLPVPVYALGFCLAAVAILGWGCRRGAAYRGRIHRGTE